MSQPQHGARPSPIRWIVGGLAALLAVIGCALTIPPLMHQPVVQVFSPLCLAGACAIVAAFGFLWYVAPDRVGLEDESQAPARANAPQLSRAERLLWTVPSVWLGLYFLSELPRQVTMGDDPFYIWSLLVAAVPYLVLRLRHGNLSHPAAAEPASERRE